MKHQNRPHSFTIPLWLIFLLLAACQAAPTPTATPTPPPTATVTHTPAPTATATPSPTPEPWTLAPYPEELTDKELTVQVDATGAVQALDDRGRVAAAWDGSAWVRVLPPLPDWAEAYANHHQGVPEQIGGHWYYTTDRTVEANGETRAVQVKLLELDEKGEWLPCYDTIEELLTNQQLMTLMKLNQISAPEEALWLVRTGETIETEREDLVKLEQIIARFMEANDHLFEGDGWGAVMADGDTWLGMNQGYMEVGRLDKFNHIPAQPDYVVDGVDLTYPHAYFVLRRGNEDQVLFGGIPLRFQHTSAWFGYDQSALEWWRNKYGNQNGGKYLDKYLTELTVAVSKNQNLENDNRIQNFFFTPTSSNEVDAELSGYFSLRGVDREYCEDLFRAAGGYFIEFEPHFSNGNIFWAHMIFKDNK